MTDPSQANGEWQTVLERIDAWYARHAPAIHATLRPGASEATIAELEAKHGFVVPDDARRLYRWHDGQTWSVGGMFGLCFLDLESALAVRTMWKDLVAEDAPPFNPASNPPGAVRETYSGRQRHPFLHDGGGNHVGIDLAPGPKGTPGQVITYGRDEQRNDVLAESLLNFLRTYAQRLDDGLAVVKRLEGFESEMWSVELVDAAGKSSDGVYHLSENFPGFGASPPLRRPMPT